MPTPPADVVYQSEYIRLLAERQEEEALTLWARRFDMAWVERLLDRCRQMLTGVKSGGVLSAWGQAMLLRSQGLLEMALLDYERATADFQRSLALFEDCDDRYNSGRVFNDLGTLVQAQGDYERAYTHYRQGHHHIRATRPDSAEEAMVLNNLGMAALAIGAVEEGQTALEGAFTLYLQLGLSVGAARVQVNLGQLYRQQGETEKALNAYTESLAVIHAFGDKTVEVEILNSLGVLHRFRGDLDQARSYYARSLEVAQAINDLGGQAQAFGNLGTLYQLQSHYAQAEAVYREALALYESFDDRRGQAQMWSNLGHILSIQDDDEAAIAYYRRSLELHRANHDRAGIGAALVGLAGALRDMGRFDEAEPLYTEAAQIGEEQHNRRLHDTAVGALGTMRMLQKRWDEAEALIRHALNSQQERGDLHAQVESTYKLGLLANERGDYASVLGIVEPAWELAQNQGYGRWLYSIANMLGDSAEQMDDPGAFHYYATAVLAAARFENSARFEQGMELLEERVERLVALGRLADAQEFIAYLIDFCQTHPWAESAGPVVARLDSLAEQLPVAG